MNTRVLIFFFLSPCLMYKNENCMKKKQTFVCCLFYNEEMNNYNTYNSNIVVQLSIYKFL